MTGRTRWIGLGAGVAVGAVIAAVLATRGAPPADPPGPATEAPTPVERPGGPGGASAAASPVSQAARLVAAAQTETTGGRYAEAVALLDRAYALDPQPPTLLQLATVELALGRCRDARRTTQRVLAAGPDGGVAAQANRLLAQIGRCD